MSKRKKVPSKTEVVPPWPTFERAPDPSESDPGPARIAGVLLNVVGQGWTLFPNPGTTRQEAEELLELIRLPKPGPVPAGGPYRLEEAARAIVQQAGGGDVDATYQRLRDAAASGALPVLHPETLVAQCFNDWPDPSSGALVCTLDGLNAWLKATGSPVRVSNAAQQPPSTFAAPLQRQRAHEGAILAKLREFGFDPQALPPRSQGKTSPAKLAVRNALAEPQVRGGMPERAFGHAWQRLRDSGDIKGG